MDWRSTAICGVGESDFSRASGRTPAALAVDAIRSALDDSGLAPADVDGLVCFGENDTAEPEDVAAALGIPLSFSLNLHSGGASSEAVVATAAAAVNAGLAETVACYRSMNGRSGIRVGADPEAITLPHQEFLVPYGAISAAQLFALIAQRYLHEYKVPREHLAAVAVTFREHAQRNPQAMTHGRPLDLEQYLGARPIASPFGLYDCCLETDGAACVLVTRLDRARNCRRPPVTIAAAVARTTRSNPGNLFPVADFLEPAGRLVAPKLYRAAGVSPADIDVAGWYDCFTFPVLSQLEAYGFAEPGGAGEFVAAGELRLEGSLPSNTAGGMLSEAYVHGLNNVVEVVRQVRHDYAGSDRQVLDVEHGLCSGWGGPAIASALILERVA